MIQTESRVCLWNQTCSGLRSWQLSHFHFVSSTSVKSSELLSSLMFTVWSFCSAVPTSISHHASPPTLLQRLDSKTSDLMPANMRNLDTQNGAQDRIRVLRQLRRLNYRPVLQSILINRNSTCQMTTSVDKMNERTQIQIHTQCCNRTTLQPEHFEFTPKTQREIYLQTLPWSRSITSLFQMKNVFPDPVVECYRLFEIRA